MATSPHHILCIDDYAPGLEVRKLLLNEWGYSVTTAQSGEEGLAFLAMQPRGAIDVVIVDYAMSGLNGGEVAQVVKAHWPDVRIIMMSGHPRIPHRAKTYIDAFLKKGERSERLRSLLAQLVGVRTPPESNANRCAITTGSAI